MGSCDGDPCGFTGDGFDARAGEDVDAVSGEFVVDEGAEFGIEGGEDFGAALELGDLEAPHGQGFGHFEADVAGSDDDCRLGLMVVEVLL
ncbi:Uncharacterised protein [Mycobacterium tuberculosis]|nr:Uncharacterised protein [Mycobacterium tuberculosis]